MKGNRGYIGINRADFPREGVVASQEHHLARLLGQRAGAAWLPTDETGLALWLDAQDTETLTLSGSDITGWADKSGNNRHASGVSGALPTYQATGFNGLPTLYTTGSQRMTHALICPAGLYSAFYAIRHDSFATVGYFHTGDVNQGDLGLFSAYQNYGWTIYKAPDFTSEALAGRNDGPLILGMTNGTIWTDGSEVTYLSQGDAVAGNLEMIGARKDATGLNMTGAMAEIIVYDVTVSASVRQKAEGYLAHKWQLDSALPSGHPYKDSAP